MKRLRPLLLLFWLLTPDFWILLFHVSIPSIFKQDGALLITTLKDVDARRDWASVGLQFCPWTKVFQ
jgi:hypothetical protein